MVITDYTTYADIRAALGVSEDDIEDATLALSLYADYLQGELEDIDLTLTSVYATVKAEAAPSDAQKRFLATCRLFSTFAVAKQLTASLPLFAAKNVSDGKATVGRFDNPYKDVIASVNSQYDKMKSRLVAALFALGTTTKDVVPRVFFVPSVAGYNPITNA